MSINRSKTLQIGLSFMCMLMLVLIGFSWKGAEDFSSEPLTLLEAYNLARTMVTKDGYYLFSITSTDDGLEPDISEGLDGRRRRWNLSFNRVGTDEHKWISINNSEIIEIIVDIGYNGGMEAIIRTEDITIDSPEALILATDKFSLYPGTWWAYGHHFTFNNMPDGIFMGVTGFDEEDENFHRVNINLATMEMYFH